MDVCLSPVHVEAWAVTESEPRKVLAGLEARLGTAAAAERQKERPAA
jgi:hypothetical protein